MNKISNQTLEATLQGIVLGKLTIKCWRGGRAAPELSREAEEKHKTSSGTVKTSLELLGDPWRGDIVRANGDLRTYFYGASLPFEDGGWRAFTTKQYQSIKDKIANLKKEFDLCADRIESDYDAIRDDAKNRLNGLFNSVGFPAREDIRDLYDVDFEEKAISVGDVKLRGLDEASEARIQADMARGVEAAVKGAVESLLKLIKEFLTDPKKGALARLDDDKKGRQLKTLKQRAGDLADRMGDLNITSDPAIGKILSDLRDAFKADPAKLKTSKAERATVKTKATSIISAIDNFNL